MESKQDYTFRDYRKERPAVKGWYVWRMQHAVLGGVTLIFLARLRERDTGIKRLSPEFDYWDGYQILLPNVLIEWAEYDGEPPRIGHELIEVVGVENDICPFCRNRPAWRYVERHVGAPPTVADSYYLECCHWVAGVEHRMPNPVELAEKRNAALRNEKKIKEEGAIKVVRFIGSRVCEKCESSDCEIGTQDCYRILDALEVLQDPAAFLKKVQRSKR